MSDGCFSKVRRNIVQPQASFELSPVVTFRAVLLQKRSNVCRERLEVWMILSLGSIRKQRTQKNNDHQRQAARPPKAGNTWSSHSHSGISLSVSDAVDHVAIQHADVPLPIVSSMFRTDLVLERWCITLANNNPYLADRCRYYMPVQPPNLSRSTAAPLANEFEPKPPAAAVARSALSVSRRFIF